MSQELRGRRNYLKYFLQTFLIGLTLVVTISLVSFFVRQIAGIENLAKFQVQTIREIEQTQQSILRIADVAETIKTAKMDSIAAKRVKLLKIPSIIFHFKDEEEIKRLYDEYFKEATIEKLIREVVSEVEGDLSGGLPSGLLEARLGAKSVNKLVSEIKLPNPSTNEMLLRWQRENIKNKQILVGLELAEFEETGLRNFEKLMESLKKYDVEVASNELIRARTNLKERSAEKTIVKLENANGWVLLDAPFRIEEGGPDTYRLVYIHPVSKTFSGSSDQFTIAFTLRKDQIEDRYADYYSQSLKTTVTLTVLGTVWQAVNRNENRRELSLVAFAVY